MHGVERAMYGVEWSGGGRGCPPPKSEESGEKKGGGLYHSITVTITITLLPLRVLEGVVPSPHIILLF